MEINLKILIWAREKRGLSVKEAAYKLQLIGTRGIRGIESAEEKLLNFENGKEISRALLSKMAQVYNVPLLAFYMKEPPGENQIYSSKVSWEYHPYIVCPHCDVSFQVDENKNSTECPDCESDIMYKVEKMYKFLENMIDDYWRQHREFPKKVHIGFKQYIELMREVNPSCLVYSKGKIKIFICGVEILRKKCGVVDESKPVFS